VGPTHQKVAAHFCQYFRADVNGYDSAAAAAAKEKEKEEEKQKEEEEELRAFAQDRRDE
jgi:hypothetical protein